MALAAPQRYRRYQGGGLAGNTLGAWLAGAGGSSRALTGFSGQPIAVAPPPPAPTRASTPLATVPGLGTTVNGAMITHYGYPGDSSWDNNSGRGIGDRGNLLQPLRSVALTVPQRQSLFGSSAGKTSTGQSFQLGDQTYVDDDTAPESGRRVDVYNPRFAGLDKGVSRQTAMQRASLMPVDYVPEALRPSLQAAAYQGGGKVEEPTALGAALQTAGQYAGGSQVWTPQNAQAVGLDPNRGYIARGTTAAPEVSVPPPTTPPPGMAPGLGTVGGAPPTAPKAKTPEDFGAVPDTGTKIEEKKTPEDFGAVPDKPKGKTPEDFGAVPDTATKPQQQPEKPAPTEPEKPQAQTQEQPAPQKEQPGTEDTKPPPSDEDNKAGMRSVVSKIMQEEGDANIGIDAGHRSIFGLWEGAGGAEGKAFSQLAALPPADRVGVKGQDIVSNAWMSMAKGSGVENLKSPGMAEMILADIQHRGGTNGRDRVTHQSVADLIKEMGGIDGINGMNEADAINRYTQLRRGVWTDTGNTNTDANHRLGRERAWALANAGKGITGGLVAAARGDGESATTAEKGATKKGGDSGDMYTGSGLEPVIPAGSGAPSPAQSSEPFPTAASGAGGTVAYPPQSSQPYPFVFPFGFGGGGRGGGEEETAPVSTGGRATAPPEQEDPLAAMTRALVQRGFTPQEAQARAQSLQTVAPGKGLPPLGGQPPAAPSVQLQLGPPSAPSQQQAPQIKVAPVQAPPAIVPKAGVDPTVVAGLMKQGFTRAQAEAVAAKATVGKPGQAAVAGGASFRPGAQAPAAAKPAPAQPSAPARPVQPPAAPSGARPAPQPPSAAPAAVADRVHSAYQQLKAKHGLSAVSIGELQQHSGVPKEALHSFLLDQSKAGNADLHPTSLAPHKMSAIDRAGMLNVPGRDEPAVTATLREPEGAAQGLPGAPQERRAQIAAHAEQAIAEKRPMHISYISAPKEAEKFPTRESRTQQYEEHSPEARLMGSTIGQLVGHSLIPVETKTDKQGNQYLLGLSTNTMANNFGHINRKLAAMGRPSPYPDFNEKFFHDVEGYLGNLNAGHTGTGQGIQVGTEEHPVDPDLSHTPHKLTRHEADFINLVLNNTKAMAQHKKDPEKAAEVQAVRELARAHGALITEAGETNPMRHDINQSEPKWSQRVLEPSVRSFKTGLIHEVHPSEATLPETIRPGPEYQQLTAALHRAIQHGRPDIPIAASLHRNLTLNKQINQIEKAFSEDKVDEATAREHLRGLGEDDREYKFVKGSGGLIAPGEDDGESLTQEEHNELKGNLKKKWLGGGMDIENYRRRVAEVPLPEIASRKPAPTPETTPSQAPSAIAPKKAAPTPEPSEEEPEEAPEKPTPPVPTRPKPPKKAPVTPPAAPEAPAKVEAAEEAPIAKEKHTVYYHGSRADKPFDQFSNEKLGSPNRNPTSQWGHFFSETKEAASKYGKNVIPAKLNLKNPHHMTWKEYQDHVTAYPFDLAKRQENAASFKQSLVDKGHDGIIVDQGTPHAEHIAFHPHQIEILKQEESNKAPAAPTKVKTPEPEETEPEEPEEPAPAKKAPKPVTKPEPPAAPGLGEAAETEPSAPPAKKPAKVKKSTEQADAEAEDMRQAAIDRDNISPEDTASLNRVQKQAKAWIKKNPEVHDLSMHAYLTGQKQFPGKLNKEGIGEHFDATNPKLDYSKEEHRQKAADAVVHDVMHSLAGTTTGKPSTAYGWYDRTVRKSLDKIREIAPEIATNPDHALAYKLALAITSQGQDVFPNAESAWHIYNHWHQHGEMPTSRDVFGGGTKAEAMEANLAKVNELWKQHGTEGLHKILMGKMTSRELKQKYGLDSGEKADYVVNGAMGLGPKIGAFFSNLNGDFEPTTVDLWFSRNMNLMAGNMFGFSDKATRQDRTEKGEVVKSHLSELKDLLDSGMVSNVDPKRAAKMAKELGKLQAHPEGQLDRPTAKKLAPEIYNWARDQHKAYQKSYGSSQRSYHPDFKTPENVAAKKLDEGVTGLSDAPRTASERDQWRDIMARADSVLKGAKVHLTNADKQALLWFNIKDLFKMAGSPQKAKADYLDAAHRLVRKVKTGELPGLGVPVQHLQGGGLVMPVQYFAGGGLVMPVQGFQGGGPVDFPPIMPPTPSFGLGAGQMPPAPNFSLGAGQMPPVPLATPAPRATPVQQPALQAQPVNQQPMPSQLVSQQLGIAPKAQMVEADPTRFGPLADARSSFVGELALSPDVRSRLINSIIREVGDQPVAQQPYIESVMNRALARNQSLDATISDLHTGPGKGYYPARTINHLGDPVSPENWQKFSPMIDRALNGSNVSKFSTGNQSWPLQDPVNFNPYEGIRENRKGDESFIIEDDTQPWVKSMTYLQRYGQPIGSAIQTMGGYSQGPSTAVP